MPVTTNDLLVNPVNDHALETACQEVDLSSLYHLHYTKYSVSESTVQKHPIWIVTSLVPIYSYWSPGGNGSNLQWLVQCSCSALLWLYTTDFN